MISSTEFDFLEEDRQLQIGKQVTAHWFKDGFYYQGEGVIVHLSREEVTVQLQKKVNWSDEFTVGRKISVPRVGKSSRWSSSNCVRLPRRRPLAC